MIRMTTCALVVAALMATASPVWAASAVQGFMQSDGVTGRPGATPQGWDDKDDSYPAGEDMRIYLGALDVGYGSGGVPYHDPPGWYTIPKSPPPTSFPGGTYALFALQFNGAAAFSYRNDVAVPGAGILENQILNTPAHYSVMYNVIYTEWGSAPWLWGTDFYQTFVATTPHVTRVATRLAGKGGDHQSMTLNYALYAVNAGPPSGWTKISPTRSIFLDNNMDPIIHLLWVPYRSSEVSLTVGQTYAARWWRAPGSSSPNFAIVARTDNNDGYAGGHLYNGDAARTDLDAYAFISGGQPGTVVNHAPAASIAVGAIGTWSTSFGQTFQATGTSVAGAEIMYITGDPAPPVLDIDFQVYDGVGGTPIGPPKTCYGVSGHYEGRAAVYWREGMVPTTPGQFYYIEWKPPAPGGCNTYFMNDNVPGGAYIGGASQGGADLLLTLAEYQPQNPKIGLSIDKLDRVLRPGNNLPNETFTVRNTGGQTLEYTITDDLDWLGTSPSSGTSVGEPDSITVYYPTVSSLPQGEYAGTITVSDPEASNDPQTIAVTLKVYIPGDFDRDSDVDMEDHGHFQACLSGTGNPQTDPVCEDCLLDDDDDVDEADFQIFADCLSGPDVPADPNCGSGF